MSEDFPTCKLGVLTNNTLICPDGEKLTVYPYGVILDEFNGKFAYFQIDESGIISNAVLY